MNFERRFNQVRSIARRGLAVAAVTGSLAISGPVEAQQSSALDGPEIRFAHLGGDQSLSFDTSTSVCSTQGWRMLLGWRDFQRPNNPVAVRIQDENRNDIAFRRYDPSIRAASISATLDGYTSSNPDRQLPRLEQNRGYVVFLDDRATTSGTESVFTPLPCNP